MYFNLVKRDLQGIISRMRDKEESVMVQAVAFDDTITSRKQNCKLYDESPGDKPGELQPKKGSYVVANGCRVKRRALAARRAASSY